jgi:hypothetical protein
VIGILLLMAIWGCDVLAIDHWAWEGRTRTCTLEHRIGAT